jgi:hypothetical protein
VAAGENPFDEDSLESVWNGLTMFLERQCSENTFGSVNLWNPKRTALRQPTSRHHLSLEAPAVAGWYLQSPTPKKQSIIASYEGEDCDHQRDDCYDPEPYPHHEKSMELWMKE